VRAPEGPGKRGKPGLSEPPAVDPAGHPAGRWCDVLASTDNMAEEVAEAVAAQPAAAVALALLLRGSEGRSTVEGVILESATYAMLQASAGHQAWLAERPAGRSTRAADPVVRAARVDNRLTVTLARPERRNAYSAQMRDELLAALDVAAADPSIDGIVLRGEGPAFSAGGDLDEFGSGADPAGNHHLRLARSTAAALSQLAPKLTARLHGSCIGAGIELPAFAHRVTADPGATFRLPELAMGLIPGAGGTVSLPRRIGRHRTAWLTLTGRQIDAPTARHWGLVDQVEPVDPAEPPAARGTRTHPE
jgi:enoyl-CoA hydratase/carnithine racemase